MDEYDGKEAWALWFSGFADGEACFYAGISNRGEHTVRSAQLIVYFTIQLRDDDASVLGMVRQMVLPYGHTERKRGTTWENSKPVVRWTVSDLMGLRAVVDLFDRYPLRSRKARDFRTWRELVLLKEAHPPGCKVSVYNGQRERVEELVAELREGREYR